MKESVDQGAENTRGRLTLADLTDYACMTGEPVEDAWGVSRVPFSPQAARLSAELAANVYDLDIRAWARAGWNDCMFLVEDDVIPLDQESDTKLAALENEWRRRRARSRIHGVSPISDLARAARQLMVTDMSKSVVMTRALPDGRVLIAIAFIGTTTKIYDWFSNFKFSRENGLHNGFLELARRFDALTAQVPLRSLGAAGNDEELTLSQVLDRAAQPESPYLFWLCGHSQGGALVQVYTHLLLARGIRPEAIRAYSFAAPTVAACGAVERADAFPIYNIINSDDVVPRVGAQVRLGVDCVFYPDNAFRQAYYPVKPESRAAFERMQFVASQVRETSDAFCWCVAMLRLLSGDGSEGDADEWLAALFPHASLLQRLNLRPAEVADFFMGKLRTSCLTLCGHAPDESLCRRYEEMMRTFAQELGTRPLAQAIGQCLRLPHAIRPDKHAPDDAVAPYVAIVRRYCWALTFGVWGGTPPACCRDAQGERLLPMGRHFLVEEESADAPAQGGVHPEMENNGYEQ